MISTELAWYWLGLIETIMDDAPNEKAPTVRLCGAFWDWPGPILAERVGLGILYKSMTFSIDTTTCAMEYAYFPVPRLTNQYPSAADACPVIQAKACMAASYCCAGVKADQPSVSLPSSRPLR